MILKNYNSFLLLLISGVVAYLIHKSIFYFLKINQESFYSLEKLYGLFFTGSLVLFLILLKVKERSFDQTAMFFLLLSGIKNGFFYIFLRPILNSSHYDASIGKVNFLTLFIFFLIIETLLTIRILSGKH